MELVAAAGLGKQVGEADGQNENELMAQRNWFDGQDMRDSCSGDLLLTKLMAYVRLVGCG